MTCAASHDVRCVAPVAATLGEGPLWLPDEAALYWVDIGGSRIFRYMPDAQRVEACRTPFAISAIAPTANDRLLCTGRDDIHLLDRASGELQSILQLDVDDTVRINDGCCHPDGAFWFGTMAIDERRPAGDFYRLGVDGSLDRIAASYAITNGPAFSADGRYGYFVDTLGRRILRSPIGAGSPALDLDEFARIPDEQGYPDGLAVDGDGGVWCAHFGGARVTRFDADGEITDVVRLPVSNITKCAFGGERFDRLFIASARGGPHESTLRSQPLAGALFVADVGYRGTAPASHRREYASEGATSGTCVFAPL